MNDKAYMRCGTSEGFSRTMTDFSSKRKLIPCYNVPDKVGYVAPEIIFVFSN